MAIMDWNHMSIEIDPLLGAKLFTELLAHCGRAQVNGAWALLPSETQAILTGIVSDKVDTKAVGATEVGDALRALISQLGKDSTSLLHANVTDEAPDRRLLEPYVFTWRGNRTGGRYVELLLFPDSNRAAIIFSTGTGKPSRFLEVFCHLAVAQAGREISDAMGYYLQHR